MNMIAQEQEYGTPALAMRDDFLRWQCRVRQIAMRQGDGRPVDAIMPRVTLAGETEALGHVITIFSKTEAYGKVPEMQHLVRQTEDPAQRREKAIQLFSEAYYQKAREFSDILTATFPPASPGARSLIGAGACTLVFDAYSQRFDLQCRVFKLDAADPLFQATWWHNLLFNPHLHPDTIILGFAPDWARSTAEPGSEAG